MEVPVKPRRPPSLPPICIVFPASSSFSVLREVPVAFSCDYFKKVNCYESPYGTVRRLDVSRKEKQLGRQP
jgi:hypothetical protein